LLPSLLPSLLPLLFNAADYMEGFIIITGQIMRGGGSSSASSSRAAGKAPAIPQKRISKASGGKK